MDLIKNNAKETDPQEREAALREKVPDLLGPDEHVVLGYKIGRDSYAFTNKRCIVKDRLGLSSKKTEYLSVPYAALRGYAVETAGSMDSDVELKLYVAGVGRIEMDFVKSTDIFKLKRFLNAHVLVGDRAGKGAGATQIGVQPTKDGRTGLFDMIGDNASQIDAGKMEQALKSGSTNILLPEEKVELAFKCGRDSFCMTSHRFLQIDVQGLSGKKVEYLTVLWPTVKAFSVETAGSFFDRDSELVLFTNLPDKASNAPGMPRKSRTRIDIDFRKGRADIFAVQRFFADKILGTDTVDPSGAADSMSQPGKSGNSLFSWLGDDNRMVDPASAEREFKYILQNCEHVEMAFKGRRDMLLATSKRIISIDRQGYSGKKCAFTSLPYTTLTAFAVETAGSMDKDSELMLWTDFDDVYYPPKEDEDSPPPPPIPRRTYLSIDFKKDAVDLFAVHRFMSERCLRVEGKHKDADGFYVPNLRPADMPVSPDILAPTKTGAIDKLMGYLGADAKAVDPAKVNAALHGDTHLLQADEKVVLAYKNGRDTLVFSNKRILLIDVKGMSGKRVAYKSFPYRSVRGFAVESAGSFDSDSELKIWLKCYWIKGGPGNTIEQDLRKGKADIVAISNYLAEQTIGAQDGRAALEEGRTGDTGSASSMMGFLKNDAVATDPKKVEQQLKSSPNILQPDEHVDACYKLGRDLCVYTTKRIIQIDRQGMTGKKVEYHSTPLRYCQAFKIQTAGGMLSSEAKTKVYVDGAPDISQELSKSSSDVWGVNKILTTKILG